MDVTRPQLSPQTIPIAGEAQKRVEAVLGKMAIVGHTFLLAMRRVLGGVQINDQRGPETVLGPSLPASIPKRPCLLPDSLVGPKILQVSY